MAFRTTSADPAWFERILDALPSMVLVKGPRSNILWANAAFREFYGTTNDGLRQTIDASHTDPDDTIQYVRDDHIVFTTGRSLSLVEAATRHDGMVCYFHTTKAPLRRDGEIVGTVGISRPVEKSGSSGLEPAREARRGRKQHLDFLRLVTRDLPLAAVIVDSQRRVIAASECFRATFRTGPVVGADWESNAPAPPPLLIAVNRAINAREETDLHDIRDEDDRVFTVRVTPWLLPDGQTAGAMLIYTDITRLRRAQREMMDLNTVLSAAKENIEQERELADSFHAELQRLVDGLAIGIAVCDRAGQLTYLNESGRRLLGRGKSSKGPDAWPGEYGLYSPEGRLLLPEELPLVRALQGEVVERQVVALDSGPSHQRWIAVSARPVRSSQRFAAAATFSEITSELRQHSEFATLTDSLRRSMEELAAMAEGDGPLLQGIRALEAQLADLSRAATRTPSLVAVALPELLAECASRIPDAPNIEFVGDALAPVLADRLMLEQLFDTIFRDLTKSPRNAPQSFCVESRPVGSGHRISISCSASDESTMGDEYSLSRVLCRRIVHRHEGDLVTRHLEGGGASVVFTLFAELERTVR